MGSAHIWSFTTAAYWPPQAAFTVSDNYPAVGETVTFTNQSTGSEPLTYQWAFGDGETSQETSPTHAYDAPADYLITLTVTNAWGEDTTTAEVHVGYPPAAAFSANPTTPLAGEEVWFTNESTGAEPLSYAWDFGDGSPISTKRDPEHIYSAPGNYTVTLTAINHWGLDTAASIVTLSGWNLICIPQRTEITGIGMGDFLNTINPQTLSLTDPDSINWLVAQVAGRYRHDSPTPDGVVFTTDAPQSITLSEPSNNTPHAYTFEASLQPTHQIKAFVSNPGDGMMTPRGLILYANRETADEWTSVGKTTNHYVWYGVHPSHTKVLAFPPLAEATDLFVTAAVTDNDDDTRSLVLEATAGGVTGSVIELGPTHGVGLNVVDLRLQQVPSGTRQVSVTLRSPSDDGDSLVLVGLNVSYPCAAPILLGAVDMEGRPAKPHPSWSVPLTIWLTPDGSSTLAHTFTTATDQNGEFGLSLEGITPGLYDIRVKGSHTLRNLAPNVSLVAGENHYFFGTLLEGDVEIIDTYNQVLRADAHLLRESFNKCEGDPGFVANADLDESGCVLLADANLLINNLGKEGDIIISTTTEQLLAQLQVNDEGVLIALSADETAPAVDEMVTLTLDVDPRGSPINGGMIQLNFDPALVEVVEVNLTDQLPLVLTEPSVDSGQGVLRFAAAVLDQTITEKFTVATLSLRVKAATPGTIISFADVPSATNVVGPAGNFLVETKGIQLRTETQGQAEGAIYLPIIMR
jgi:PKD repeat protein